MLVVLDLQKTIFVKYLIFVITALPLGPKMVVGAAFENFSSSIPVADSYQVWLKSRCEFTRKIYTCRLSYCSSPPNFDPSQEPNEITLEPTINTFY